MAERFSDLGLVFCWPSRQNVGSNPNREAYVLEQDTLP